MIKTYAINEPNIFGYSKDIAILNLLGQRRHTENRKHMTVGIGLKTIMTDLKLWNPKYINVEEISEYRWCLINFTSHYDVIAFSKIARKIKKGKCQLVAGGAGLNNPELFSWIIDYQIVGRAEDMVPNLIYNDNSNGFFVDGSKKVEIIQPKRLIKINGYEEKSVGCSMGCNFCQYGWKFKNQNKRYFSGATSKEDFITHYDWTKKNGTTAIDGCKQETRYSVNKKISDEQIVSKLNEVYNQKWTRDIVKIYNIIGFPNEKEEDIENLRNYFKLADKKSNKTVTVWIHLTHFVPMRFTPMEKEKVSFINFRKYVYEKRYVESFFRGETFNVSFTPHITTPKSAYLNWCTQAIHEFKDFEREIKNIDKKFK